MAYVVPTRIEVTLEGAAHLMGVLDALPAKIAFPILRKSLREGAKIFMKEARATAPQGPTGRLKRSFKAISGKRRLHRVEAYAKSDGNVAPHTHLVEFGTAERFLRTKSGKLKSTGIMRANPFMRRAWYRQRDRVERKIIDELGRGIERGASAYRGARGL
ncbi:MAG TPA: HK97-gp10 family putative phage morphogenesis protein [Thermoguttaceae bacterium]|nr:HK97-gp10 family putative phage morphogenesis protein [Thermoguttaceae bacterium]